MEEKDKGCQCFIHTLIFKMYSSLLMHLSLMYAFDITHFFAQSSLQISSSSVRLIGKAIRLKTLLFQALPQILS